MIGGSSGGPVAVATPGSPPSAASVYRRLALWRAVVMAVGLGALVLCGLVDVATGPAFLPLRSCRSWFATFGG